MLSNRVPCLYVCSRAGGGCPGGGGGGRLRNRTGIVQPFQAITHVLFSKKEHFRR
jgi:hypothetical protein